MSTIKGRAGYDGGLDSTPASRPTIHVDSSTPGTSIPNTTAMSGSVPLNLDSAPLGSVPLTISEHLSLVRNAVSQEVGGDVFGGARFVGFGTPEVTMTIYGTQPELILAAIDRIAVEERTPITFSQRKFSVNAKQRFGGEAARLLREEGIDAWVGIPAGQDTVEVDLFTPSGEADTAIESVARSVLGDLPATYVLTSIHRVDLIDRLVRVVRVTEVA